MKRREMLVEDKQLLMAVLEQRDQIARAHSRLRIESLKAENGLLKQLDEVERRLKELFGGMATRAGVTDPKDWQFDLPNGCFLQTEVEPDEEEVLVSP